MPRVHLKVSISRSILPLVAFALVLIVLFGRLPFGTQWALVLANSAHGPVFAVIAAIILSFKHNRKSPTNLPNDCTVTFAAAVLLGIAIELLQASIGRDGEVSDVATDALGALTGMAILVFVQYRDDCATLFCKALFLSGVAAFALVEAPVVEVAAAYYAKQRRYPILMDAGAMLGTYFVTAYDDIKAQRMPLPKSIDAQQAAVGLRIRPGKIFPWGLGLSETTPDWSGRHYFAIQLANSTDSPQRLKLRIYDAHDPRNWQYSFYASLVLEPHSNAVHRISLADIRSATGEQHIDLREVSGVVLYGKNYEDAPEFYLIRMWLE